MLLLTSFLLISMSLSISIPKNPSLLEISTRPWLYELSQKYKRSITKLSDIPDAELNAIKNQGYHIVWFMGLWELGELGLKHDKTDPGLRKSYDSVLPGWTEADVIGSPYAITNYSLNPSLGTLSDLKSFINKIHSLGLAFFCDLVPNHSAIDSPLLSSNSSYYIHAPPSLPLDPSLYMSDGTAYGRDPYSGGWTDTAQYNIFNNKMRERLENILLSLASLVDGVRCDMAMLELNSVFVQTWKKELEAWNYSTPSTEFWREAISKVKKIKPSFKFIAEAYWGTEETLLRNGFDYIYDKDGLYNRLRDGNLDNIRSWISSNNLFSLSHFTENHDEERAITSFGGVEKSEAATVVSMTLPGMKFYFQGQREGKENKLDVHLRRSKDEAVKNDVVKFYDNLQSSLKNEVWRNGDFSIISPSDVDGTSWRILAWKWKKGIEKRLVVVNYSDSPAQCKILLPDADEKKKSGETEIEIKDELNDEIYKRNIDKLKTEGIHIVLDPWKAHILNY